MIIHVPLNRIDDNPFQRRQDYGDVEGLATDIAANGLLQTPIGRLIHDGQPLDGNDLQRTLEYIVRNDCFPDGGFRVQLGFGHRRLRAIRQLNSDDPDDDRTGRWATMPIDLRPLTDDQMLNYCWSENQRRTDINPIEQAELLAEKLDRVRAAGGSQTTLATEWGLDRSTIANKLRLLDLPPDVQTAIRNRQLSERQATALLPLLDLEAKLNGTPVPWGDTTGPSWNPRSPAGYITQVLADPDHATSDAIRNYTQTALKHAGLPLGDAFAAYDAGPGRAIIQPDCKGCPSRINQTCLHPPCHAARLKRYLAAIPEWASRETGLPIGDPDDFPTDWRLEQDIAAQWQSGNHANLVVGVSTGSAARPFAPTMSYPNENDIMRDWKHGVRLGRRVPTADDTATGAPESAAHELRPKPSERATWKKTQTKADKDRLKRVRHALDDRIRPLAGNETALRALVAMLDGYWVEQNTTADATPPTADDLAQHLLDEAWKRADTYHYDDTNRAALRRLLQRAGIHLDHVDPPDRLLMLLDIGQDAILYHDERRDRTSTRDAVERLARVRQALAEFDTAPHVVADHEELLTLQRYLRAARTREEQLLYTNAPTADDLDDLQQLDEEPTP